MEGGRVERRVCLFEQFWIETENEIMKKEIETEKEIMRKETEKETEKESKNKTAIDSSSTAETTIETEKEHNTSYQNVINVLHKTRIPIPYRKRKPN